VPRSFFGLPPPGRKERFLGFILTCDHFPLEDRRFYVGSPIVFLLCLGPPVPHSKFNPTSVVLPPPDLPPAFSMNVSSAIPRAHFRVLPRHRQTLKCPSFIDFFAEVWKFLHHVFVRCSPRPPSQTKLFGPSGTMIRFFPPFSRLSYFRDCHFTDFSSFLILFPFACRSPCFFPPFRSFAHDGRVY